MDYWDSVDAAAHVIDTHGLQMAQSWGMAKYNQKVEGVAAMIQQAALDFLSTEFKGFPKELVVRDLSDREDELYPKWVEFAKKLYGINNHAAQETGWEMIMGGPYGDPGLTDFPKRGALHQSKRIRESFDNYIVRKGRYRVLEPDNPIFSHMKIDELMQMTGLEIRALWMRHLPADVLYNFSDFFNDRQLNALASHHDKDIAKSAMDALE